MPSNHLTEKEMPEGNWLSEEALQIAVKPREAKNKKNKGENKPAAS